MRNRRLIFNRYWQARFLKSRRTTIKRKSAEIVAGVTTPPKKKLEKIFVFCRNEYQEQ